MRISDWSSDVCSSDLRIRAGADRVCGGQGRDVVVNQDERSLLFGQCRRGQHENGDEQGCEAVHFPSKLPHFGVEWNGFPAIRSLPGAASPARAWIVSLIYNTMCQL